MNNIMGSYKLKCYGDHIKIPVHGVMTTPNCFNISRIQIIKYGMRFLMVIGKQSDKLGQNGLIS